METPNKTKPDTTRRGKTSQDKTNMTGSSKIRRDQDKCDNVLHDETRQDKKRCVVDAKAPSQSTYKNQTITNDKKTESSMTTITGTMITKHMEGRLGLKTIEICHGLTLLRRD